MKIDLKKEILMNRYKDYIILDNSSVVNIENNFILSYAEVDLGYRGNETESELYTIEDILDLGGTITLKKV